MIDTTAVSAKIRIAACHIDYSAKDLSAIVDSAYQRKIESVETRLNSLKTKPNLIIFPEYCGSDYLLHKAIEWSSNWNATTVCGTRLDPKQA